MIIDVYSKHWIIIISAAGVCDVTLMGFAYRGLSPIRDNMEIIII